MITRESYLAIGMIRVMIHVMIRVMITTELG
jgi:hypothetical protein